MRRANRRNIEWATPIDGNFEWSHVTVEVLMDIRHELRRLNGLLHCSNFVEIPTILRGVRTNTAKRKRAQAKR